MGVCLSPSGHDGRCREYRKERQTCAVIKAKATCRRECVVVRWGAVVVMVAAAATATAVLDASFIR